MAEIVFNNDMQSFLNNLETRMLESTYDSINNKKAGITYKVIDSFHDNMNGYKEFLIESLTDSSIERKVEDYFEELRDLEVNHIQRVIESMRQVTDSVIRQAEEKSERELESSFNVLTHEIIRRQNATLYDDLNYDFSSSIATFLSSRYDYNAKVSYAISDVQTQVKRILNKMSDEILQEFQSNLNGFSRYYIERTIEVISEQAKEQSETQKAEKQTAESVNKQADNKLFISKEDIAQYASLADKMGLQIEETFDGFTVKAPNSEKAELLYKGYDDVLYTFDHSIELSNYQGIHIAVGNNTICEDGDTLYFGTIDDTNKVSLTSDFLEYEVKYAGNLQTEPLKKGIALAYVEKNFPEFYKELRRDALFQALEQEISTANKKVEELYKDAYGIVHINKENAERFNDKVSALGFYAFEKTDGVYLVDRKGVDHKIQYESGYAFLEDEPTVGFNTNQYIVTENEIKGPRIDYHKADINLSISTDFMDVSLTGPNQTFFMGYGDNKKFRCVGNNAGTKVVNAEVIAFLSRFCPEAFEKVKNTCLAYEAELRQKASTSVQEEQPAKETTDVRTEEEKMSTPVNAEENVAPIPNSENNEIVTETEDLMTELDSTPDEQVTEEEFADINTMDIDSIYQEMNELQRDRNVRRYLELLNAVNNRYQGSLENQDYGEDNSHRFK